MNSLTCKRTEWALTRLLLVAGSLLIASGIQAANVPLPGVDNGADIGWYARTIRIPAAWKGQRVFLVIGACDWHTTVWLECRRDDAEAGRAPR